MECLCGKKMVYLGTIVSGYSPRVYAPTKVWSCPPEGCGRLLLEGGGYEVDGTWYTAEQNLDRSKIYGH